MSEYARRNKTMNTILIDAIIAMYGMTKTEAKKYAKTCDDAMKNELIKAYRDNARKAFYND